MNSNQIGITAATVFVVAGVAAIAIKGLSKPTKHDNRYSEELDRPRDPRRFPVDEYIYGLNPDYRSIYDADRKVEINRVSEELDFDRPGYNANRYARDPTIPDYDPFRNKPFVGGTRCVNCHSRLRYTRRK